MVMKLKKGFVLEEVGGSYLAVATGALADTFRGLIRLNGTGAFIWRLLSERDMTRDGIVDAVLAAYDAPRDRVEQDVDGILATLTENGILDA